MNTEKKDGKLNHCCGNSFSARANNVLYFFSMDLDSKQLIGASSSLSRPLRAQDRIRHNDFGGCFSYY